MNNFNFHVTTDIRFGKDRLGELPEALAQFGKKVLLVFGGGSIKKNGLYDRVTTLLSEQGFDMWELAGVEPNPRVQTVKLALIYVKNMALTSSYRSVEGLRLTVAKRWRPSL